MRAALLFCTMVGASLLTVYAQQPAVQLTGVSVNVSEPGKGVRIDLSRWSTDQEREQLLAAMNPPPTPPAPAAATPDAGARGGDAARGARGGARGARGARGGRGGRGGAAAPFDPIVSLTTAIGRAPTIGYIWTNEVAGYSIKYALRIPSPDGGERIILATDRRIGAHALAWQPASGTPPPYEFTLLDIRLNSAGSGEGKASIAATVAIDKENETIGLENYANAPALLENVKRRTQDR
jgi:hypothetical protein